MAPGRVTLLPIDFKSPMNADTPNPEKLYKLTFQDRIGYLYAFVEGENDNAEVSAQYWREILAKCNEYDTRKLLVEEDLPGGPSETEVYHLASALSKLGSYWLKIAFVDRHLDQHDLNQFAELVAVNRGVNGKIFTNTDEAEKWLLAG
jgi:hypothetical protein